MAPREELSVAHRQTPPSSSRGEHLGTFAVRGAFALVVVLHKKEQQRAAEQHEAAETGQSDRAQSQSQEHDKVVMYHQYQHLVANIGLTSGGFAKSIELYGEYVARQIGLKKSSKLAKTLADLSMEYLNGDKSSSDHSLDSIVAFLSTRLRHGDSRSDKRAFEELVRELDACMISYFSFHWHHSGHLLDQVRTGQRNLRSIVMAATRKHRFQRAMQTLKTKRAFTTLLETLKAMRSKHVEKAVDEEEMVKEQLKESSPGPRRRPVLLMVGGGMGAGKSTVVNDILHGKGECLVRHDAVVVEADAFKETDVLYRSLSSGSGDVSLASQLVHDSSTQAASSLLVSALNEGRDVIFDGTMSWEPFVVQTIEMARDVHRRRYRLGPGYKQNPLESDGVVVERYWEPVRAEEATIEENFLDSLDESSSTSSFSEEKVVETFLRTTSASSASTSGAGERPAYRIVLVGVTCDALLAVVRGIRRAIITNRFVPIQAQLRSHKMFAGSLERYCELVDSARIYSTSKMGGLPELVGFKDDSGELRRLNEGAFQTVRDLALLNPDASSVLELYEGKTSRVWEEIALAGDRQERQKFLNKMLVSEEESEDESSSELSSPSDESSSVTYSSSSSAASSTDCLSRLEELTGSGLAQGFVRDD